MKQAQFCQALEEYAKEKEYNYLNIDGIKIHMLHIIENTDLADYYNEHPFHILSKEE